MALTLILVAVAAGLFLFFIVSFMRNIRQMTAKGFPDDYWAKRGIKEPSFPAKESSWAGNTPWSAFMTKKYGMDEVIIK